MLTASLNTLFLWLNGPEWARAFLLFRLHDDVQTHHIRYESPGQVISTLQRPLIDNTQHLQVTDIHAPAGFEPAIQQASDRRPTT
jgi:hypothetical protein